MRLVLVFTLIYSCIIIPLFETPHDRPFSVTSEKILRESSPIASLGQVRPWPYRIYAELELENMHKWMCIVITRQYGRTTTKLLATQFCEIQTFSYWVPEHHGTGYFSVSTRACVIHIVSCMCISIVILH